MPIQANTPPIQMGAGETLVGAAVNVGPMIPTGVTLTGTPVMSILPDNSPDPSPTVTNPQVSVGTLTIRGESVAAGKAIQYTLTGNSAAKGNYVISFTCGSSNSGVFVGVIYLKIL